jgi:hypothetical protein
MRISYAGEDGSGGTNRTGWPRSVVTRAASAQRLSASSERSSASHGASGAKIG